MSDRNRLCVIGHPIAHSRSPRIYAAAFRARGIEDGWSYEAIDVPPKDLQERVQVLGGEGFVGTNVTIPHKRGALELADEASEEAQAIGASNHLTFIDGRIRADNTDAQGLTSSLPNSPRGWSALVLGAGGAGRAACFGLAREGAGVRIWNRTPERAEELARDLHVEAVGADGARAADVVVNATSVGLAGVGGLEDLPIDPDRLGEGSVVVDLVYGDRETELCAVARERGARVVDGLEVLAHQAACSFRIWTGLEPPVEEMRAAAHS